VLQLLGPFMLCLGNVMTRHPSAPLEVPVRISVPTRAFKTTTEALIGFRLDDCDARVGIARRALALDIAARIFVAKLQLKPMFTETNFLSYGSANDQGAERDDKADEGTHEQVPLMDDQDPGRRKGTR